MDAGDPLPFDTQPGGGGGKPVGRNKRRSSILKPQRPVLQDLNTNTASAAPSLGPSKPERSRRVSFSRKQQIKEFKAGQDNLTLWNSSYHEELSSNSSSNVSSQQQSNSSKGGGRVDLQGGQLASVSPSKALPLNINIPDANSPNKFLPSAAVETDDILRSQPAATASGTRSFLSSLASAEGRRESESSDDADSSFSRLLSNISSKTMVGEVDMSRTCAAISDSMLPDDDDEGESVKVNALGFLAGLEDESVHEGDAGKTVLGGGMDVTMGNRMEMTLARMDTTLDSNPVQVSNRTTLGGGMDVTMAISTSEKMEMSVGRVEPASSLSKTVVGGGMDITMEPITAMISPGKGPTSKESTVPDGNNTRHGGGMETTLVSSQTDYLPDSLPNSNNSSFDGGATATVKFSQLALANNTLMLPRKESEEEEEEDFTRAPEQVFSYDPCQVISVAAPPVAPPVARATSILKKIANDSRTLPLEEGAKVVSEDDHAMEMSMSKVHKSVPGDDMEMTMGGGENPRTLLTHDVNRIRETKISEKAQPWNRTTVQGQDMELTKMGGEAIMEDISGGGQVDKLGIQVATGQRERSPQRTQPWNKTSIQGEDMEMTRAGAKSLGDRTSVNQENMEMTKIAPQITIQSRGSEQQDDMEVTQTGKESVRHKSPSISPSQEEAVAQAEESGWETMHSPIISVSPLLTIQPCKAKSQGELLRENFPSPAASPSPEMTRMLSGMPGKPKSKAGIWDGDVTSFMPVGESTRAIKIRLPIASTISPACSPVTKPGGKMEVGDLTSFAPGEEYESTRKLPARSSQLQRQEYESLGARPKSSLKSPSVSPLPLVASKQVGDLTSFSPLEDYESTRKLPVAKSKVPLQPHSPCVSTVDEEVTSPNRGARIQETMLPGLEVTAAPGCFCFTSHRGGSEGNESRMKCTVHMNATISRGEEKQMGSSMAQGVKSRSPPQKRSSEEFEEELSKRQRRLETEEDQTEGEEEAQIEESGERNEKEEVEGKESPEKRLKLSVVGERLAALANQSLAHVTIPNNQSVAQVTITNNQSLMHAPTLNNQSLTRETISSNQCFSLVPTSSLQVEEEPKVEDQAQQEIEAADAKGKEGEEVEQVMPQVTTEMISADAENNVGEEGTVKESSSGQTNSVQSKETEDVLVDEMSKLTSLAPTSSPTRTSSPVRTSSPSRSSSPVKVNNLPGDDAVVSIFKVLETRQRQKQAEAGGCKECDQHHGGWKLLGFNDQVAALTWLEGSLMLEIKLGEKLKLKKSRKTMGGNIKVEHHLVTAFQWRSLHLDDEEMEEEDRLTDKCISEAHSSLTRRFTPALMGAECLNTYSLAALLSKISHYTTAAASYLTALNRVRWRFFPFTVEDGVVTVGFVSLTLEQSLTLAVDFSAGFSAAPSSVKVVESLGGHVQASTIAKIVAETVTPGPLYISELADKVEEFFKVKENALIRRKSTNL